MTALDFVGPALHKAGMPTRWRFEARLGQRTEWRLVTEAVTGEGLIASLADCAERLPGFWAHERMRSILHQFMAARAAGPMVVVPYRPYDFGQIDGWAWVPIAGDAVE